MPRWSHHLRLADVFHSDALTFEQRRDVIVTRIKAARWYTDDDWTLSAIVDELADTTDADDFNQVWDEFYGYADACRIWVATV